MVCIDEQYETDRISALESLHILNTPRNPRFDRITNMAQILLDVPIALISFVHVKHQWFKSCIGLPVNETPRGVSFCAHAILDTSILEVQDATQDPRFAENALVTGAPYIRFYAGRPVNGPGTYRIGTLCVIDTKPRKLSLADKSVLNDLATWVENELELVHLHQNLEKSNKLLKSSIQTKQEMSAMISHDFINALSPIASISDMLLHSQMIYGNNGIDTDSQKLRDYIETIHQHSFKLKGS